MSIRKKLYLNFGLMLAIALALCLFNVMAVWREHSARAATAHAFDVAQASENIRFQMMQNRQLLSNYLLSGSSGDLNSLTDGLTKLQEDIRKIAELLSVTNVLEGSVRKAGNRIRITAQLIDASRGSHLWSQRYDRDMTDIFAIQDEISQAIVEKLRVHLTGGRIMVKRRTENIEAYNLYLLGRFHFRKFTPEDAAKSKEYFEKAIAADPNYAEAFAALADYELSCFSAQNHQHIA